jgi:hypothetical protein
MKHHSRQFLSRAMSEKVRAIQMRVQIKMRYGRASTGKIMIKLHYRSSFDCPRGVGVDTRGDKIFAPGDKNF